MRLTREYFEKEYVEKERTSVDIAAEVGLSPNTVRTRMKKLGIPVRSRKAARLGSREDVSEETLREFYTKKKMTVREVAAKTGFSPSYIARALCKFGLNEPGRTNAGKPSPPQGRKRDTDIVRRIQETKRRRHSQNGPTPKPLVDRFWSKVAKSAECWLWQGTKNNNGYGLLLDGSGKRLAHRISWELHFGSIPHRQNVLHKCDNPACVRPDHLFLGSMQSNSTDMYKKGRWGNQHAVRLSSDDVCRIRKLYDGGMTQEQLAALYGVHQTTISRIVRSKRHRVRNDG